MHTTSENTNKLLNKKIRMETNNENKEVMSQNDIEKIEALKKVINLKDNEIYDLMEKCKKIRKKYKENISYQIAQLRAVQILFDVMKSGSTHRQKEQFAAISINSMESEIEKLIRKCESIKYDFALPGEPNELPF